MAELAPPLHCASSSVTCTMGVTLMVSWPGGHAPPPCTVLTALSALRLLAPPWTLPAWAWCARPSPLFWPSSVPRPLPWPCPDVVVLPR